VEMKIAISAVSPQIIGGQQEVFAFWSNCGSQSQNIVVPPGGGTYTARLAASAAGAPLPAPSLAGISRASVASLEQLQCRQTLLPVVTR